jgi:nucleoid-associated protein YgaU
VFFKGSRYELVETATFEAAGGRRIRYKRVRFIPPTPASFGVAVRQGDRLDLIAERIYQEPELFWRICDANVAVRPDDLIEVGRTIRIPPPEA